MYGKVGIGHFSHTQCYGVFSMKRLFCTTVLKTVAIGVVLGGMATACQNGDSPVSGFLESADTKTVADTKTSGALAQNDEERKAEQNRKIAEFLAKPEVREMSSGLEEIAQAVAVAVEDKALRDRIYEKCMEKFDGETNTLWMHLEGDSKLKTNGGWNKRIDAELGKGSKNTVVKGIGNVDAAIKKFEKTLNAPLHLFWAFPQNWDKKTTPIVAFTAFDVNPKTRTKVFAYDSKGNRIELDSRNADVAKKRPVIVLAFNERAMKDGSPKKDLRSFNQSQTNGKSSGATVHEQTVNLLLYNVFFWSNGAIDYSPIGVYDEWLAGEPEFHIAVWDHNNWKYIDGLAIAGYMEMRPGQTYFVGLYIPWQLYPNSIKIEYWEEDFWFADDYIGTHTISSGMLNPNSPNWVVSSSNPTATYRL
jgi:hypothetical protein